MQFCTTCGAAVPSVPGSVDPYQDQGAINPEQTVTSAGSPVTKGNRKLPILIAVIAAAAAVVAFMFVRVNSTPEQATSDGTQQDATTPNTGGASDAPTSVPPSEQSTASNIEGRWEGMQGTGYDVFLVIETQVAGKVTGRFGGTSIASGNTGTYRVTGTVKGNSVVLKGGQWIERTSSLWSTDNFNLTLSGDHLHGTSTSNGNGSTSQVDLQAI